MDEVICVGMVSHFFNTSWIHVLRILHVVFSTSRVHEFEERFSQFHLGLYTMQEPSHVGKLSKYQYGIKIILTQIRIRV